jgi:hypothetical protein
MLALTASPAPPTMPTKRSAPRRFGVSCAGAGFPPFLPKEVENIKDPSARKLATRIERLPVPVTLTPLPYKTVLDIVLNSMCLPKFAGQLLGELYNE